MSEAAEPNPGQVLRQGAGLAASSAVIGDKVSGRVPVTPTLNSWRRLPDLLEGPLFQPTRKLSSSIVVTGATTGH